MSLNFNGNYIGGVPSGGSSEPNPWVSSFFQFYRDTVSEEKTEEVDLSNYLPNDNNTYEVMFRFYINASSTDFVSCRIYDGSFITSEHPLYTGSVASQVYKYSTVILTTPISTARKMMVEFTGALQTAQIQAFGYRKVI